MVATETSCAVRDPEVALPGGTFAMGDEDLGTASVKPFYLDVTEVTVSAYAKCVAVRECAEPSSTGSDQGDLFCNWGKASQADHPINCVSFDEASAYCAWQGKRLPTEEEWEWAARGTTRATKYPWGNKAPSGQLCWHRSEEMLGTCPEGSHPAGDSPQGVKDLAGNVWEWTSTVAASDGARIIRGGGWYFGDALHVTAAFRIEWGPKQRNLNLGFRCARKQ